MNEPEVIRAAVDSKFYDVILTAYNFQQKHYAEMRNAIDGAAQAGIGIVGMKAIRGWSRQTAYCEESCCGSQMGASGSERAYDCSGI